MKNLFSIVSIIIFLSCNNQASNANGSTDSTGKSLAVNKTGGNCANNLYFRKGTIVNATTYDGNGKVLGLQTTKVTKVYSQDGATVSELDMNTTNAAGKDEKIIKAEYRCDGENLVMDMNFLRNSSAGTSVKASGLYFPLQLKVGQSLPDAGHTINISSNGKDMKIKSEIKQRKVEAKETITTPAGKFEAYKISAIIEATTEMEGMTEAMKESMKEMQKRMGENRFIIWYTPELTILRMEMYMGGKLQSKTEVTSIRK